MIAKVSAANRPSPLSFLGSVAGGIFFGAGPGHLLFIALETSWKDAVWVAASLVSLAIAIYLGGWILIAVPLMAIRRLSMLITKEPTPAAKPADPMSKRTWFLGGGFWLGFFATLIVMACAGFAMREVGR